MEPGTVARPPDEPRRGRDRPLSVLAAGAPRRRASAHAPTAPVPLDPPARPPRPPGRAPPGRQRLGGGHPRMARPRRTPSILLPVLLAVMVALAGAGSASAATTHVTADGDEDGRCTLDHSTLGEAITAAKGTAEGDQLLFAGHYVITP